MKTHSEPTRDSPAIDAAFPGGNISVLGCEGMTVRLAPDLRNTVGHWFYWRFRATFPCAGTWRFAFEDAAVGTRGPAVRRKEERGWRWLTETTHESDCEFAWSASWPETIEHSVAASPQRSRMTFTM